jgi:ribosomal protein S18 acetylase RimI-like enzyme
MEPARYRISEAAANDLDDIVALFKAYESHIGVDLSYQGFDLEVSTLPGKYAPPTGQLMIARDGTGAAIGCVALRRIDDHRCEMKRLFVSKAGRGLGVGRKLAETIIDAGRQLGYAQIVLDTLPTMRDAIGLYERLGFSRTEPYYSAAPAGTIFMCLDLADS